MQTDASRLLCGNSIRWLLEEFEDNGETVIFALGAPFYEIPGSGINEVRIAYVLN